MLTIILAIALLFVVAFTVGALFGLAQLYREAHPEEGRNWEVIRYNEWVKKHSR